MSISVEIHDDGAVFRYPPEYELCVRQFDKLQDQLDGDEIGGKEYLRRLGDLTRRYPLFIDGHAHVGFEQMDRGRIKAALKSFERGFNLGEAALPPDFRGKVEWPRLDNRPFLRAAGGVVECLIALDEIEKAVALMEKILAWDPNDHQGWRFQIGSEYLRNGREEEARELFETNATEFPPYWYELGLYWLLRKNHAKAATCMRLGFVGNPYVAEALFGAELMPPLTIWHDSSFARAATARSYRDSFGAFWVENLESLEFLRWLHGHPRVLAERAAIFECGEALVWERDISKRSRILERKDSLLAKIDDSLSRQIVVPRVDRHGQEVMPWTVATAELLHTFD